MYFDHLKTVEEVKNRFKLLAKKLHPDVGGDKVVMQEINLDYEKSLVRLQNPNNHFSCKIRNKIECVLDWADNNPSFDKKFVLSLLRRLDNHQELTYAQLNALNNIINKFKIDIK